MEVYFPLSFAPGAVRTPSFLFGSIGNKVANRPADADTSRLKPSVTLSAGGRLEGSVKDRVCSSPLRFEGWGKLKENKGSRLSRVLDVLWLTERDGWSVNCYSRRAFFPQLTRR